MRWEAGLRWALGMLGLDVIELAALLHITFVDRDVDRLHDGLVDGVELYLAFIVISLSMQILGILLVQWGHYRAGAVLQIVSSAPHVLKLEGIIGVMGGIEAWKFASQSGQRIDQSPTIDFGDVAGARTTK